MSKPSVILLGSKPGAVVALSEILKRGWNVHCVVTSPEFENDWLPTPSLKEYAEENCISVFDDQNDIPINTKVDFVFSYMFRYLVSETVIKMAKVAALNFHAGPLPEFGGWAFYNIAILESSYEYGCTCHYMDNNFDTGPLLKVHRFPIDSKIETAYSLERITQKQMIVLFIDVCDLAENGTKLPKQAQQKSKMRYMNKYEFEALKQIPEDADSETIDRYARAFWYPPYEGATIYHNGSRIEILPEIVKKQLATLLHSDDLQYLYNGNNKVSKSKSFMR